MFPIGRTCAGIGLGAGAAVDGEEEASCVLEGAREGDGRREVVGEAHLARDRDAGLAHEPRDEGARARRVCREERAVRAATRNALRAAEVDVDGGALPPRGEVLGGTHHRVGVAAAELRERGRVGRARLEGAAAEGRVRGARVHAAVDHRAHARVRAVPPAQQPERQPAAPRHRRQKVPRAPQRLPVEPPRLRARCCLPRFLLFLRKRHSFRVLFGFVLKRKKMGKEEKETGTVQWFPFTCACVYVCLCEHA